jgi:hypothetical protein
VVTSVSMEEVVEKRVEEDDAVERAGEEGRAPSK